MTPEDIHREPPESEPVAGDVVPEDLEAIRCEYVVYDWAVRIVATIHLLIGTALGGSVVADCLGFSDAHGEAALGAAIALLFACILAPYSLVFGLALCVRTPFGWRTSVVFCVLGLLFGLLPGSFLVLLIQGAILFLLVTPKGRYVFSPEYLEIVRRTRSVKLRALDWLRTVFVVVIGVFALILLIGPAL